MTDKTPAITAPAKPAAIDEQSTRAAAEALTAARKPATPATKAPATGVAAMPKAWHDDQAKQRAADTRFDGSRFRRK